MEDTPYRPPSAPVISAPVETPAEPVRNPWLSIWWRPRATIRSIVTDDPARNVHVLAILGGVTNVLNRVPEGFFETLSPALLAGLVLAGILAGLLQLYLGGALIGMTGDWLGGEADVEDVRASIAWSNVPAVPMLLLLLPPAFVLSASEASGTDVPVAAGVVLALSALAVLVLGLWAMVLQVACLAEVQRFSIARAIGSLLLAGLVIGVPILLVGLLLSFST